MVVVTAHFTEGLPTAPCTAVGTDGRSAVSALSHSRVVARCAYVAVTRYKFDLAAVPCSDSRHASSQECQPGTGSRWRSGIGLQNLLRRDVAETSPLPQQLLSWPTVRSLSRCVSPAAVLLKVAKRVVDSINRSTFGSFAHITKEVLK
jgi:hypothetical protein